MEGGWEGVGKKKMKFKVDELFIVGNNFGFIYFYLEYFKL